MSLTPGTPLGPYEVLSLLGSGGMGEVYRAKDTKLSRNVALKILPEGFSQDSDRLARFQREAKTLASLNHPHIAAIYGLEESDGVSALVMELVEGEDLSQRIARGPIRIAEALRLAKQIAEAFETAHEQGIIHRDLKPANIKVTPDGRVKVLDFGLAKTMEPAGVAPSVSQSPTVTTPAMTQAGMILGTAAYMSPEQAKGRPADKRSDIWAFACVLYEMLSGRPVFTGESTTDILAAVIHTEPNFGKLPAATPAKVRALLERCLQKDLHERQRDIGDVRLELQQALKTGSSPASAQDPRAMWPAPSRSRAWFILGMSLAVIALAAIVGYRLRPEPTPRPFRLSILPPEGTSFLNVSQGGAPALSPDGRLVAFVASGATGQMLWVQSLDAFDARPLPGTEGARSPFWSPDGRSLAFFAQGKLAKVDIAGGQPQSLGVGLSLAGTWNREGKILFSTADAIAVIPASGGTPTPVTEMNASVQDENHFLPVFLPDSRHYLLQVRGGTELEWQVWVGELGSNNRRLLVRRVTNALYAPSQTGGPGFLFYVRDRTLMAHPFDADRLAFTADAVPVAQGVAVSATTGSGDFSVSRSGVLAYRVEHPPQEEMAWFDRSGKRVETLGDRPGNPRNNLRLSPDGKFAAFTRQGEASQDVWIYDLVRGVSSRLTFNGGRTPVWSPDGSQIAYLRGETIYRKPMLAPGSEVSVWTSPDVLALNDWSGDGRYLLVTRWEAKAGRAGRGLWLLPEPLADSKRVEPILLESPALHGQFAPRVGPPRWVSFDSEDAGVRQVFVRTMPGDAPARWQVSTGTGGAFPELGGNAARWRRDGREMYFVSGASFVAVTVEPGTAFRAGAPRVLFEAPPAIRTAMGQYAPGYDVNPDGQRFLSTLPSPQTPSPTINVIMNWQATLVK